MSSTTQLVPSFDEQDVGDVVVLDEGASNRDAGNSTAENDDFGRSRGVIVPVHMGIVGEHDR
jgi:hypothetical protein